jgi:hypothetical protein
MGTARFVCAGVWAEYFKCFIGDIMKSTAECYKALLDGERLICKDEFTTSKPIRIADNGQVIIEDTKRFHKIIYPAFEHPEKWEIYEEPKWYENIPEDGVLCWVSDIKKDDKECIAAICHHNEKVNNPYIELGAGVGWKYATPLTKEEIQVFLNNVPND